MDERTNRNSIKDGVFLIEARLVIDRGTGQTELASSPAPLVLSDSWFNNNFREAGRNLASWLDDMAARHSRTTKKRGKR